MCAFTPPVVQLRPETSFFLGKYSWWATFLLSVTYCIFLLDNVRSICETNKCFNCLFYRQRFLQTYLMCSVVSGTRVVQLITEEPKWISLRSACATRFCCMLFMWSRPENNSVFVLLVALALGNLYLPADLKHATNISPVGEHQYIHETLCSTSKKVVGTDLELICLK